MSELKHIFNNLLNSINKSTIEEKEEELTLKQKVTIAKQIFKD